MDEQRNAAISDSANISTSAINPPQAEVRETAAFSKVRYGFTITRLVLGVLLLTSAALKLFDPSPDTLSALELLSSPRWQMAAIEVEALLGLWLLTGGIPASALAGGPVVLRASRQREHVLGDRRSGLVRLFRCETTSQSVVCDGAGLGRYRCSDLVPSASRTSNGDAVFGDAAARLRVLLRDGSSSPRLLCWRELALWLSIASLTPASRGYHRDQPYSDKPRSCIGVRGSLV